MDEKDLIRKAKKGDERSWLNLKKYNSKNSHSPLDNEVNSVVFPSEIPVLKLISSVTQKQAGEEAQINHLNRLGTNAESKIIDGSHLFYQTNITDVSDATSNFLEKIN